MVEPIDCVGEKHRVQSDWVAIGCDHQVVQRRGHLSQSVHLLQAAYIGGVEGEALLKQR